MRKQVIIFLYFTALCSYNIHAESLNFERSSLYAYDGQAEDNLGGSMSVSFDYIIAGAGDDGGGKGAAYIFARKDDLSWDDALKLSPPSNAGSNFGMSVSLDSSQALVGSIGGAHLYMNAGDGRWLVQKKFSNASLAADEENEFGSSVALEANQLVVIGCSNECEHATLWSFDQQSNTWTDTPVALAHGLGEDEATDFGYALAVANYEVVILSRSLIYAAHHFYYDSELDQWECIHIPLPESLQANSMVATKSVSFDGVRAVVGLPYLEQALIYGYDSTNQAWDLLQSLSSPLMSTYNDAFGSSVHVLRATGEILIGAPATREESFESARVDIGQAYLYVLDSDQSSWSLDHTFKVSDGSFDRFSSGDRFGEQVGLADRTYVMSVPGRDNSAGAINSYESSTRKPTSFPTPFPTYAPTPRPTLYVDSSKTGSSSSGGDSVASASSKRLCEATKGPVGLVMLSIYVLASMMIQVDSFFCLL